MTKYIFSGHETFHCKSLWLKKGYDFIMQNKSFNDDDAVIELGVGKNMVASIKYWMRAFGMLTSENELTDFANKIFSDNDGLDKYLEDKTTLWLLHYMLVKENYASIYNLTFTEFHRKKNEFDISGLDNFVKHRCSESDFSYNQNTVDKDIKVLLKNYIKPNDGTKSIEEYSNLLVELDLLSKYIVSGVDGEKKEMYSFNYHNNELPPCQLLMFLILEVYQDSTIDFQDLMQGDKGLGLIFCLTTSSLDVLLKEIDQKYNWVVYSDDAGIRQIQIKERPSNSWLILNDYYQEKENNEI